MRGGGERGCNHVRGVGRGMIIMQTPPQRGQGRTDVEASGIRRQLFWTEQLAQLQERMESQQSIGFWACAFHTISGEPYASVVHGATTTSRRDAYMTRTNAHSGEKRRQHLIVGDDFRRFLRCSNCDLVRVEFRQTPSAVLVHIELVEDGTHNQAARSRQGGINVEPRVEIWAWQKTFHRAGLRRDGSVL